MVFSCFTQPLAAVAVTVYVPGCVTETVAPGVLFNPGPFQVNVGAGVLEADSVTLVFTQVSGPSFVTVTTGALLSTVTVVFAWAVQPLIVDVASTE
jgi:hypothetical protein